MASSFISKPRIDVRTLPQFDLENSKEIQVHYYSSVHMHIKSWEESRMQGNGSRLF